MRYEGFLTSGAATLTPTVKFDTRNVSIGGQGSWTVFESGNQILQLTAAAAWLSAPRERWRVELSGAAGASRYADEAESAHILARSRLHFSAENRGGWFSAGAGATVADSARAPIELAIGAWHVSGGFALVGTVTAVSVGRDRYIDVAGAVKWSARRMEVDAVVGVRPFAKSDDATGDVRTGVWGEISAAAPLSERIALTISGGSYRSDPVRRVLGADYITAGLRLALAGARESAAPLIPIAPRGGVSAEAESPARLEIAPAGRLHSVRIQTTGARSVEIMGDFTDWQPLELTRVSADRWQVQLQLGAGVHRLNVRIDGGKWIVPRGARPEADEFGGVVGVVAID